MFWSNLHIFYSTNLNRPIPDIINFDYEQNFPADIAAFYTH